jgi:N-acetyl-alpha-D-muramate 1-phosphate uridylyltransferase
MNPDARPAQVRRAMVLAAGLGQRMRPITDTLPKPLVVVGGKPMLDHALDRLAAVGVETAIVNVHHLADQIERHLATRILPRIVISDERAALLETGGGVKKALPLLGSEPFFHLNSDSLWAEPEGPPARSNLGRMAAAWDGSTMDILLLLAPTATSFGYDGRGDFHRAAGGSLTRRGESKSAAHVYAGVAILKPELFHDAPEGAFSLNRQFDAAIAQGRLCGHELQGQWLHVGTPDAIAGANLRLLQI